MDCRDPFPILYAGQQNSCSGHVGELATESLNRGLDNFQTPPRLTCRIGDFCSLSSGVKVWCGSDDFVNDIVTIIPAGMTSPKNHFIEPSPDQMLRVMVGLA